MLTKIILQLQKMKQVQDRMMKGVYKKAVRAGTKLIIADLKNNVPVLSGALKKSISSKVDSAKGSTVAYGIVGPRSKFIQAFKGKIVKPSRYAAPLDKVHPFLLPAWESNKAAYIDQVQQVVAAELKSALST